MNDKKYCIYIHIFPNNKVYVGQTCQLPERRWRKGINYKTQPYVYRAIQKYGWESIKHRILAINLKAEDANYLEDLYIVKIYKSNDKRFGYNCDRGGKVNPIGFIKANEKRKKRIVIDNVEYESICEACRKLNLGKIKVRALAGLTKPVKDKVRYQVTINGITYKSIFRATQELHMSKAKIRKLAGIDKYKEYNPGNSRPIVLNGIHYLSIEDAIRKLKVSKSKIYKMLKMENFWVSYTK